MMRPSPRRRIDRSAAIVPYTVTSVTRWNSAGLISATREKIVSIASLIQMSTGPNLSSSLAAAAKVSSASATSAGSQAASTPKA